MKTATATLLLALAAAGAQAQTTASNAWVRATVPQQQATGLFMQLKSAQAGRLVAASSPVAGVVEIHEMKMDGNVMRMRAVEGIDLPAGQPVDLTPGGYHVMLMNLKQRLAEGDSVPVVLEIAAKDGKRERLELQVPVKAGAAAGGGHSMHKH